MVIQNYRDIRARAAKTLSYTPWDVKKTAFVFGGVPLAISLVLTCIDILLSSLHTGGGIAAVETYGILSTVSTFLWTAANIFQLLWSPAILYCGLMLLREQNPYPSGLFRGFKKWKPLVRLIVLLFLLFFAVAMVLSMVVATVTAPFMTGLMEMAEQMPETEAEMIEYMATMPAEQLTKAMLPFMIIYLIAIFAVTVPFMYRARIAFLLVLDEEQIGARQALRYSFRQTKGSCWQLFRLDLSFWWYYLLAFGCSSISYLQALPIFDSWNEYVLILVFTAVQGLATLGVYMLGIMKINTANAVAYDHLRTAELSDLPQLPEGTL